MTAARRNAMPQYMMMICEVEKEREEVPQSEFAASYAKVSAWWEANEKAGLIVAGVGNRLQPGRTARTVRVDNGKSAVTDGPFAETKETLGGFGLIAAPDMQAAVELVKTWPGLPVAIELRPVVEM
jgi:hypothetical protein